MTQKTLDSLSGNFRRHHNTKRILATQTGVRKIAAKKKSTLASINSIIIETVETTSKPKKKPVKRKAETEESEMNDSSKKRSGAKRKPDAIDEESKKLNMNLRSRFSSNEYDMVSAKFVFSNFFSNLACSYPFNQLFSQSDSSFLVESDCNA